MHHSSQSQVKYRLLHGRLERIGEASADTAATETYYMKGYYNLEEEKIKVKIWLRGMAAPAKIEVIG